ncbi:hypothetical protein [Limimaricola pyoseonensis]|uniref:Lipoprotein n=1 Tax=Limimaricola pyoseonensis TaxID=521013 RepID=A0A1G7ICR6_9RHOB|nr:hypothetical protein [Limimaricola pyoseonensis]SDF10537.1 hypothetical protein SAMN04488567_3415 [Limimaricola pyoseonensis]
MTSHKIIALVALGGLVSACAPIGPDKSADRGINAHSLSTMVAGIWVDPNGCDHWIIDDGVEGYMSERLTPDGRPVCSGVAQPEVAAGPFKDGSPIPDPL